MPRMLQGGFEVVSITPMALRADSRTLKQAASVQRLGYKSIVVEGRHSGFKLGDLPFEVITAEAQTPLPSAAIVTVVTEAEASDVDAGGPETPPEPLRPAITRWAKFRHHWRENRAAAMVITAKHIIILARRVPSRVIMYNYYLLLRIINFLSIKITIISNRILYNEPTAFLRHIASNFNSHIYPTKKLTPSAKLYYLHAPYQFPAIALRCIFGRSKYIYDAHDFYSHMDDHSRLPSFWARWILPWEGRIERWCVRHASAVVTVNQGIAGLMKSRFGCDVVVLRNSHDPRLESDAGTTLRQSLGLGSDALLTVCIGQWKRDTAIVQAMQAFATLPSQHHLAFLGAHFPSYALQITELGLEGRVHFHPAVKANEVVPFVRSADFGLLLYHAVSPSIRNCLPNGFFQPLAAGLPVLYPDLPEIARIAAPLDLGLEINPLDPASIAKAVNRLGSDGALRAAKKANVEAARHQLSWERDEELLKKLVEDLIGPPQAA